MKSRFLVLLAALAPVASAHGQVFTYAFGGGDIPDDAPGGGLLTSGVVPDIGPAVITGLTVSLSISERGVEPAYNGDFYAYLRHSVDGGGTGFAVLLNRVGSRSGDSFGYGDNGFNIIFDDGSPTAADIHLYRQALFGSHDTAVPSPGVVTGTWLTDGRETDPGSVLDTDPRTATLASFVGLDPRGVWQLYIQDVSGGGTARLDYWNLAIATAVVPEPEQVAVAVGAILGAFVLVRRFAGSGKATSKERRPEAA